MSGPFTVTEKYTMSTLLNFLWGSGGLGRAGGSVSDWDT